MCVVVSSVKKIDCLDPGQLLSIASAGRARLPTKHDLGGHARLAVTSVARGS